MANSKEKKSSIIKDALSLTLITIICSFALAFVYEITKDPIKAQKDAKKNAGYQVVFKEATKLTTDEALLDKASVTDLATLDATFSGITITDVVQAQDDSGNLLGYIISTKTRGYASTFNVVIGYSLDGVVKGLELLDLNDSPGFGKEANSPEFKDKFAGVKTDRFVVTKSGSSADNEIDVYSSATITTEAIVKAVNSGIAYLNEYAEGLGGAANE